EGAGPGRGRATLCRGARRSDRRSVRAGAGGALPAAAPAGGGRRGAPTHRGGAHHVEPRAVRRLQREPDPRSEAPASGTGGPGGGGGGGRDRAAARREKGRRLL